MKRLKKTSQIEGISEYNIVEAKPYSLFRAVNFSLVPGKYSSEDNGKKDVTTAIANTDTLLHEYFKMGSIKLTEGVHIKDGDGFKVLISDVIAERNSLGVGDKIKLSTFLTIGAMDEIYEFEVAGIFKILSSGVKSSDSAAESEIADNLLFITVEALRNVESVNGKIVDFFFDSVTFYVDNPRMLDEIVAQAYERELIDNRCRVTKNSRVYDNAFIPIERTARLVTIFQYTISVAAVMVLFLILLIWAKERRRETGIYLSLGIKKGNIFFQHLVENIIICVIATMLAWGIAAAASAPVGDIVLSAVSEKSQTYLEYNRSAEERNKPIKAEEIDVSEYFDAGAKNNGYLIIAGGVLAAVLLATAVSSCAVLAKKPKEILSSLD